MAKRRLDQYLVEHGLAESRSKAQGMILAGKVRVNGQMRDKAGFQVPPEAKVEAIGPEHPYVSRGGVKLAGALDYFDIDPTDLNCLDVGASTGGFSDCLLQRGAVASTCVDVGYGQLAWKLREDPRITVHERVNVRFIPDDMAVGPFDLVTVDVSFISLTLVTPPLIKRMAPTGRLLCLVKPQFEAGRDQVGQGGVVRHEAARMAAVAKVHDFLSERLELKVHGYCPSPIKGPKGNQEYFILAEKTA
jgi:23S rRNA (cytidine1920-2'-O)/16S rRNA (cytidine1409-2'-O)-methyltransferase